MARLQFSFLMEEKFEKSNLDETGKLRRPTKLVSKTKTTRDITQLFYCPHDRINYTYQSDFLRQNTLL